MKLEKIPGEDEAWAKLATLDPVRVCCRAEVRFDEQAETYALESYGCEISVSPREKKIFSDSPRGADLLDRVDASLAILWYLTSSHSFPPSGNLIAPGSLPGGQIFEKGTHVLPLEPLAEKYADAPEAFIETGRIWGGDVLDYGDASVQLFPLPQVPTTLILRTADEEFPSLVNLLIDSNCKFQFPTDIVWAMCMMSALIMR
ncbi:MAG: DUF3786 domain-containing protein [Deltaproteobacteria bacterium]|jgi:hypothetical protein|nr:DUF3786 domain-containing protein [Deltaproteobacteria bacterium]MBW2540677.1 DUF3786 domain-containing protein [Deltaproteobacteria bacterium]